jgi:hypothetical protein
VIIILLALYLIISLYKYITWILHYFNLSSFHLTSLLSL